MEHVRQTLGISERRACRVLGQHRSTQRKPPQGREDEARLTADVIELAREYGRYGYRRVAVLLRRAGWQVNHKRVARIWRREGLKVPHKQKKRGRLWLNDGSCVRLKPEHPNHVWSYDFVQDRTVHGQPLRMDSNAPRAVRAALSLMPIDGFDPDPVVTMQVVGDALTTPETVAEAAPLFAAEGHAMSAVDRFAFYELAQAAYAIVHTREARLYGNFIIRKGVIEDTDAPT